MKFPTNTNIDILTEKHSLQDLIRKKVFQQKSEDAFFLADLGKVVEQHKKWVGLCPNVVPFYAVKCNNDPVLLQTLALLGTGYDCASKSEIEQVLSLGVSPDKIIFANPCKIKSHIEFARDNGVSLMTFDSVQELEKIKTIFPGAKLVLRLLPPPTKAVCNLGCKYGVETERAPQLIEKALELDLNLMGVSFHVGSGCLEADAFTKAINQASQIFKVAQDLGFNLELLDIGGGFPGHELEDINFESICKCINDSLDKYFPGHLESGLKIIAEPGRFYASAAYTLVTNIIGKRDQMYYINDGVYGSFNCLLYDHAEVDIFALGPKDMEPSLSSSVWGPTCDGLDCVLSSTLLPCLDIGDWLYFPNMGAYTLAAGSTFNGMPRPNVYHVISHEAAYKDLGLANEESEDSCTGKLSDKLPVEDFSNYLQTSANDFLGTGYFIKEIQ